MTHEQIADLPWNGLGYGSKIAFIRFVADGWRNRRVHRILRGCGELASVGFGKLGAGNLLVQDFSRTSKLHKPLRHWLAEDSVADDARGAEMAK